MDLSTISIATVLAMAFVYLLFDVLNRRNVPTIFAYATFALAFVFTLASGNFHSIETSLIIVAIILTIGYALYRIGQLGAADVVEFAAISMIIPIQPAAYLTGQPQFGLPFILSVFIATGLVALVLIPLYYIPRASRILKKRLLHMITNRDVLKGILVLIAYGAFMAFTIYEIGVSPVGLTIIALVMISSSVTVMYERPITDSMVEFITPREFEEGDIIALRLMKEPQINSMKRKIKGFGNLVTRPIMREMLQKKINLQFPVYRQAMPFAVPIFFGLIISLLYGNVLLLIL